MIAIEPPTLITPPPSPTHFCCMLRGNEKKRKNMLGIEGILLCSFLTMEPVRISRSLIEGVYVRVAAKHVQYGSRIQLGQQLEVDITIYILYNIQYIYGGAKRDKGRGRFRALEL